MIYTRGYSEVLRTCQKLSSLSGSSAAIIATCEYNTKSARQGCKPGLFKTVQFSYMYGLFV